MKKILLLSMLLTSPAIFCAGALDPELERALEESKKLEEQQRLEDESMLQWAYDQSIREEKERLQFEEELKKASLDSEADQKKIEADTQEFIKELTVYRPDWRNGEEQFKKLADILKNKINLLATATVEVDRANYYMGGRYLPTYQTMDLLSFAIHKHSFELVKLLLEKGASANPLKIRGITPLHRAIGNNDLATGELLLKSKADIDAQNEQGDTPLHTLLKMHRGSNCHEVCYCNKNFIETLIKAGADVSKINDENQEAEFYTQCPITHSLISYEKSNNKRYIRSEAANAIVKLLNICLPVANIIAHYAINMNLYEQ